MLRLCVKRWIDDLFLEKVRDLGNRTVRDDVGIAEHGLPFSQATWEETRQPNKIETFNHAGIIDSIADAVMAWHHSNPQ